MGLAYTEKCGKCQEVGFTHFISGNICESDGMHDKQQLCSYRTLKTWKEFHHTVTSWNHSIMASRSRRHRSMSWSSSHLSASSMELPIWRPSMSITAVNTNIDWFKERKWTFLSTFKAILDAPWGSNTPLCTHYTTTPGSVSTPWKSHISILHWASSVTHSAPQYQRHRVSGIVVIKRLLLRHELKVCAVLGDILFTPVSLARGHSESPGQTGCRKSSWRCTSGIFEVCSTPPCSLQWNSGEPVEQTLREFCPQVISLIKCLKYHVKIFAQFGKLPFYCFRKWIMDAIPAVGNPDALRFIKEKYLAETITVFEAVQALITSFHMVTATTEAIEVIEVGKSQHI